MLPDAAGGAATLIERLLVVAALAVAIAAGAAAVRAIARRRVRAAMSHPAGLWAALDLQMDGRPAVVAFSSPHCIECSLQARIAAQLEAVRVIPVDAAASPGVARAFGVLTTPSTAVLSADGRLVAVNHGLATADRLRRQLAASGHDPDLPSERI